jgi:hypothetical protein
MVDDINIDLDIDNLADMIKGMIIQLDHLFMNDLYLYRDLDILLNMSLDMIIQLISNASREYFPRQLYS